MALKSVIFFVNLITAAFAGVPQNSHDKGKRQLSTFDYVIVGGGTAGLALADRLSLNSSIQVAVIEAGVHYEIANPLLSSTPAGDVFWAGSSPSDSNPLVDWSIVTQPQAGANSRRIHYPRGKCLGGSSARNFMLYQRGTVDSYSMWAKLVNDESYEWDALQPHFKRSVKFSPPGEMRAANASAGYDAAAFDSAGGPLRVSYANYASPFSSYIEGSLNEIGISEAKDFNSGRLMGAQYAASTINPTDAKRDSSETSFLKEASSRRNLHVFSATKAKKIIFSGEKATGVRVAGVLGLPFTINARREVIVSAGVFHSPQLLIVSGIGPLETLLKFNITPVSVLPGVGQNMWDHIFFGPSYRVKVDTFTRLANQPLYTAAQFVPFSTEQKGPLTNPVCDFLAWEKVPATLRSGFTQQSLDKLARFPADWPEIEYLSAPGYVGNFSSLPFTQPTDGYQYATIMAALVAPLSRGTVTVSSTNTDNLPIVDPRWLTDPADQEVAVAAYKRLRQAFASKAMAAVLADPVEFFPGPAVKTDAQILETIRNTLHTVYHASGTCKMGTSEDPTAVVDSAGRVFGTQALRVVDASSFALLPPGHPQSTVYMLAEKIAEGILEN